MLLGITAVGNGYILHRFMQFKHRNCHAYFWQSPLEKSDMTSYCQWRRAFDKSHIVYTYRLCVACNLTVTLEMEILNGRETGPKSTKKLLPRKCFVFDNKPSRHGSIIQTVFGNNPVLSHWIQHFLSGHPHNSSRACCKRSFSCLATCAHTPITKEFRHCMMLCAN